MMKEIAKIFLTNKLSCTMIIPHKIAKAKGMDKPCYVKVEDIGDAIRVTKVDLPE